MPVTCYQIADFTLEPEASVVAVTTYSLAAPDTNIERLLRMVAPSVRGLGPAPALFDPSYRYQFDPGDTERAVALLKAHQTPIVTPVTNCAVSACLDFYQHPAADGGSWQKTEVGDLIYQAKYRGGLREAGPDLAARATAFIRAHPVMSSARGVAAVPSSQAPGVAERGLVAGIARWLSRELRLPLVRLERLAPTPYPQKNLPRDEDPDMNQANTMSASIDDDGLVLLVDDLMRDASTVNEATRALLDGGASSVASLTLAKEYTGTRGFQFP